MGILRIPDKDSLNRIRFTRDSELLEEIRLDSIIENIAKHVKANNAIDKERHRLLANSLKITDRLMPNLISTIKLVQQITNHESAIIEAYVYDDSRMNASCADFGNSKISLLLTSAIVQKMTEEELSFVIGHELGHAIYGHHLLPARAILASLQNNPELGVPRALKLMSWSRCAEISADRVGLLCCQDYDIATTVMMKLSSGLTQEFIKIDPGALLDQMNEIEEKPELADPIDWYADHPFNPLRVYALNYFWQSDLLCELLGVPQAKILLQDVDRKIITRLALMEPYNKEISKQARDIEMECLLWGCFWVAAADDAVVKDEIISIRSLISDQKVDEALAQIRGLSGAELRSFIKEKFNDQAEMYLRAPISQKQTLIQQMITVAMADQILREEEKNVLREICKKLGIDIIFVDRILKLFE